MDFIPYSKQDINDADISAVTQVLQSDFITQGPAIEKFEHALTSYCGATHAIAVASGTAGLHLICLALNLTKEDVVWTSPISFVASANCARYIGAHIDFIDIDSATGNICINALKEKLQTAKHANTLPKAIIIVHYAGRPCDMKQIKALTAPYDIILIEDAAHALGATDGSHRIGSCKYSTATMLSFHPVKSVTTGEGGAILTNDDTIATRIKLLRSHGITRENEQLIDKNQGSWYYEMQYLGYHYRITDIQAALGISQLTRLDTFIHKRFLAAQYYDQKLSNLPLILPPLDKNSAWHLYPIQLSPDAHISRRKLFEALRLANIGVNVHYIPIHLQPYYKSLGFNHGDFAQSELFYDRVVSIPIFATITQEQQDYVIDTLTKELICS